MIPLLDFTDLPRTPAALAGTIVGNQLRFWRGAMTLMGAVPAAQMALAREAMAATYGVTGKTGTKTALPSSSNDTVAKPAPARRKATRKPARPAQSAAVKKINKPAPSGVITTEAAASKATKAVATPTQTTSDQSGFASQRTTSGGSAAKPTASKPSAPAARRKTPRAPSKPAQMPATLKSAAAKSEAKPVVTDSRQMGLKQTGTTSAQALMAGQAAGAAPGQQDSGKQAAAKPTTAKPAAAKAKPASKSRAKQ
ncbi:hypothetical protein [Phaeobacter gallaeciensis]|uniref:Uncharacterized protein n=1 Tax=Phaeobacter gallaeciensis TaxID=60890 RepID=A0AAC9Z794_9RHOB|nr:hypothetical protein [Phaeobacter gallaeciensis]AHD08812.1 hypothetical protein Gal_01039 [Phaeobacter gallaeciensis DSM 26640]ATE92078.1 hypothetical protein PhaeoP11_01034 [Phaeobacter gallaeciensis]ATE98098.1 hypothetical protein PhaeoP73_02810 [Phaeobacter gallaeciensis]ATF00694.1 hypothetical protein PhaeoP75_01035 [Phaeobacter gallaeciensis]ATF05125.1 hypothetical protein PhaeoP63_01034 [Phaeobacter gallaeciensis]